MMSSVDGFFEWDGETPNFHIRTTARRDPYRSEGQCGEDNSSEELLKHTIIKTLSVEFNIWVQCRKLSTYLSISITHTVISRLIMSKDYERVSHSSNNLKNLRS